MLTVIELLTLVLLTAWADVKRVSSSFVDRVVRCDIASLFQDLGGDCASLFLLCWTCDFVEAGPIESLPLVG